MADPGDTAALCNDSKSRGVFEEGQPADLDLEAGTVIGEEPTSLGHDAVLDKSAEGEQEGQIFMPNICS